MFILKLAPDDAQGGTSGTPTPAAAPTTEAPAAPAQTQAQPAPAPQSFPPEVLSQIKRELATTVQTETSKAIDAHNQRILQAMGVQNNKPSQEQNAQFLERFIENPAEVLAAVATQAVEVSKRERAAERGEEVEMTKAQRRAATEARAAASEILGTRPDITSNPESFELLDFYFSQTDEAQPMKERLATAVKKHDKFLEKQGAGKTEERISRASTALPSPNGNAPGGRPAKSYNEQITETNAQFNKDRIERYKKTHGGHYPGASK